MSAVTEKSMKEILILGAGELGMNVTKFLSERIKGKPEYVISVLLLPEVIKSNNSFDLKLIKTLSERSIKIIVGDVVKETIEELALKFKNYHTIVGCLGFSGGRGIQIKITEAVLKAKVMRYFPWQFGVNYDLVGKGSPQPVFDEQYDVRTLLRSQQNTEWVIVSVGMITSFLFEPSLGVVDLKNQTINALGDWNTEVTVTSAEDIGRLTAEIILFEPRIINQVMFVAGDTISYKQLAEIIEKQSGTKFKRIKWDMDYLKKEIENDPQDNIKRYRAVFGEGIGVSWSKEKTFNFKEGLKMESAEQWVMKNLIISEKS
ncbi:aromatic alcohol reductase [Cellulophaga baltica]|uniref:aromatic alcohol reductase n=1 Tax=Cellulophaga baltica TaxID=76594 RepID=UPI00214849D1|nr:aromatic alcohol reductase [Cellulophaga baltica]MCR1026719.1 aromatic alcohol reductase [Cellulophaga baltica]